MATIESAEREREQRVAKEKDQQHKVERSSERFRFQPHKIEYQFRISKLIEIAEISADFGKVGRH